MLAWCWHIRMLARCWQVRLLAHAAVGCRSRHAELAHAAVGAGRRACDSAKSSRGRAESWHIGCWRGAAASGCLRGATARGPSLRCLLLLQSLLAARAHLLSDAEPIPPARAGPPLLLKRMTVPHKARIAHRLIEAGHTTLAERFAVCVELRQIIRCAPPHVRGTTCCMCAAVNRGQHTGSKPGHFVKRGDA